MADDETQELDDPFGLLSGTEPLEEDDETEEVEEDGTEETEEGTDATGESEGLSDSSDPDDEDDETLSADTATSDAAEVEGDREDGEPSAPPGQPDPVEVERQRRLKAQQAARKLRQENAQLRAAQQAQQAPNPALYGGPQPAVPQPGAVPPGVPGQPGQPFPGAPDGAGAPAPGYTVEVGEDGRSVYVPREAIDQSMESTASRVAAQQLDQFQRQQDTAMEQVFVMRDPERNAGIVQMAREVDEYVGLAIEQAMLNGTIHVDPALAARDQHGAVLEAVRAAGIVDQIAEIAPQIVPHFEAFMRAQMDRNPFAKLEVFTQLANGSPNPARGVPTPQSADPPPPKREGRVVEKVVDTPPSMARKGSGSRDTGNEDEREFQKLYKTMLRSPGKLSKKQRARMNELGVKLGKDGFDDEMDEAV